MSIYRILRKDGTAIGPAFEYASQATKYIEKHCGNSPNLKIKKVRE